MGLARPRRISLLGGGESTRRSAVIASWLVEVRCSRRLFFTFGSGQRLCLEDLIRSFQSLRTAVERACCRIVSARCLLQRHPGSAVETPIVLHYSQSLSALTLLPSAQQLLWFGLRIVACL